MSDDLRDKYPSNSFSEKKERPTVRKVAHARTRKVSLGEKVKNVLILGDFKESVTSSIQDIAIPYLMDLISDSLCNIVQSIFQGGDSTPVSRRSNSRSPYRDYTRSYRDERRNRDNPRDKFDFDSIVFDTMSDAENVLSELIEILDQAGEVKVSEFFKFAGVSRDYTDERWGWTNLSTAHSKRVADGYILKLPKPEVLER